jgi:hypothetical protein
VTDLEVVDPLVLAGSESVVREKLLFTSNKRIFNSFKLQVQVQLEVEFKSRLNSSLSRSCAQTVTNKQHFCHIALPPSIVSLIAPHSIVLLFLFVIYIMSYSPLATTFSRFLSTLSSSP